MDGIIVMFFSFAGKTRDNIEQFQPKSVKLTARIYQIKLFICL
jgi:hypothetical protein